MNYFCAVDMQSKQNQTARIFIVLEPQKDEQYPHLTEEILTASVHYKAFCHKYHPKKVASIYVVYETEKEVYTNFFDEKFEELIKDEKTKRIAEAEIIINLKDKKHKKKIKVSPIFLGVTLGSVALVGVVAFNFGTMLGNPQNAVTVAENVTNQEDGFIIPKQEKIVTSKQITVSIDRSYLAVPTEDLQLKGGAVGGRADITLPEFDKTDFFTHVPGYTWGFTSDPNGDKIEYYGGQTYEFKEDTKLYRVLVKYGGGNGTKQEPYLINYYDQLELMSEEKARGYFKQTEDIIFPDGVTHNPINTINELKSSPDDEIFEYDGNGFKISNLNAPLFSKVSGAIIKNVNITNSTISTNEDRNYGFLVCEAYNYRYSVENSPIYDTGETLIQNCSVSHSAIYIEPLQTEETTETQIVTSATEISKVTDESGVAVTEVVEVPVPITKEAEYSIGAITGIGGEIENCYVTDFGIFANNDYYLYAGGISGKPANVKNSAVYYFSANGNIFNAGGIAGCGSGSKFYDPTGREIPKYYGGNIQGCLARNIIIKSEISAGGIVGEGGTNAENSMISNCYANELSFDCGFYKDKERQKLEKPGACGGIVGTDGNNSNGHFITNSVSLDVHNVVGNQKVSSFDETVRLAPAYSFYLESILTILNRNSINPNNPKEIFTGSFQFGESSVFGDETGSLAYPTEISILFEKTVVAEEQ